MVLFCLFLSGVWRLFIVQVVTCEHKQVRVSTLRFGCQIEVQEIALRALRSGNSTPNSMYCYLEFEQTIFVLTLEDYFVLNIICSIIMLPLYYRYCVILLYLLLIAFILLFSASLIKTYPTFVKNIIRLCFHRICKCTRK